MHGFEFYNGTKIVCGEHAVEKIARELLDLHVTRPLLITDSNLSRLGLAQIVLDNLDASNDIEATAVFDEVPQDSDLAVITRAVELYQERKCDGVIALGGGSVIDTAKSVAISLSYDAENFLVLQGSEMIHRDMKPLVVIPTTSGTGSEVTCVAVVANHNTNTKLSFTSYKLNPHVAILDPLMTASLPSKLTITTGMDALTHAVESVVSSQRNPVSDSFAKTSIRLIRENIIYACEHPKDRETRTNLAVGSLCAGIAFSNAMVGIVHALGHALGGACTIPHGHAMMLLLPWGMEYNLSRGVTGYGELLPYLAPELDQEYSKASTTERDVACIQAVRDLNQYFADTYDVEIRLRDLGVDEAALEDVAHKAFYDGAMLYNPIGVPQEDALDLLRKAF